jgi:WD40 repeat protein
VSGSSDNTVRIWDISTGELLNVCMESDGGDEISSVKFHPNGYEVIAGGFDGFIRIWNIKTGKLSNCLTGHSDWVYTLIVHLSDINDMHSSGKLDRKSKDKKTKSHHDKAARKSSHDNSPSGESLHNMQTFMIISGSWDNTVKIWEQNILRQSKKKTKRNFKFWK